MAYTLQIDTRITLNNELGDDTDSLMPYRKTRTFTALEDLQQIETTISNETIVLWDATATGQTVTSFGVFCLWANQPVYVEFTTNEGHANEELHTFTLAANVMFCLGSDDSHYGHSASNALGGTLDVIDRIRVKEPNTVSTIVRAIIAK